MKSEAKTKEGTKAVTGEATETGDPCNDAKNRKNDFCKSTKGAQQLNFKGKGEKPSKIKSDIAKAYKKGGKHITNIEDAIKDSMLCQQIKGKQNIINECLQARKDASHAGEEADLNSSLNNLSEINNLANC